MEERERSLTSSLSGQTNVMYMDGSRVEMPLLFEEACDNIENQCAIYE